MTNEEILQQIDKLKLMILMSELEPTEQEKFHKWIDEMQGRACKMPEPWAFIPFDNRKYATYRTIRSMVEDLYEKEEGGTRKYQEDKREIRRMIASIVAMTMFYQEQAEFLKGK